MENAIIGLTTFILGVGMGLWCRQIDNDVTQYVKGFNHGFDAGVTTRESIDNRGRMNVQ